MKLNEDIERLRSEQPRPGAAGDLISKLQHRPTKHQMKNLTKISIPAAIVASIVAGTIFLVPKTAFASPESVAKAIRSAKNYVIKSFGYVDGKRILMSKTTINGKEQTRVSFDDSGREVPTKLDVKTGLQNDHVVEGFPIGDGAPGEIKLELNGSNKTPEMNKAEQRLEVSKMRDGTGKETTIYKVNGKKVSESEFKKIAKTERVPGFKLGGDSKTQGLTINVEGQTNKMADGSVSRQGMAVVGSMDSKGNLETFVSGQTSVDNLLKMLADESRWKIERGVVLEGRKLDKFVYGEGAMPIELYVDPATSLPQMLRFNVGEHVDRIEDVYEYTPVPTPR